MEGLIGLLECVDFADDDDHEKAVVQLVSAIKGEPLADVEPGVVRKDVSLKQLTNPFLDLIDKGVLPSERQVLPAIDQSGSAVNAPNAVFLSYVSKDREFVATLKEAFANRLPSVRVHDRLLEPLFHVFSRSVARDFRENDVFIPVLSSEYLHNAATFAELDQATRLVVTGHGRLVPILRRPCKPPGLAGILEAADFTDPAKNTSSMEDLIAGIQGSRSEHTEPGEVRPGLTIKEIGTAATEINHPTRRR
jgi:TIR domain